MTFVFFLKDNFLFIVLSVNLPPLTNVQAQFEAILFYNLGFNKLIKEEKVCEDNEKAKQGSLHDIIPYLFCLSAGNFKDAYWAKPSER